MGEPTQDLEGTEKENESFLSPFSEVQGIFFGVCMRVLLLFFIEIKNCNTSLSSSNKLTFRQYAIE